MQHRLRMTQRELFAREFSGSSFFILEKRDIRRRKEVWERKTKQDITFAYLCVHFFSD
jgi:hypothetical protein